VDDDTRFRLQQVISRLTRQWAPEENLMPSQYSVLSAIVRFGPVSVSELAGAGFTRPCSPDRRPSRPGRPVTRAADPADLRSAMIAATANGHRAAERIQRSRTRVLTAAASGLTTEQQGPSSPPCPVWKH
jgi:DNA-binding MarR family transcriptional regulator